MIRQTQDGESVMDVTNLVPRAVRVWLTAVEVVARKTSESGS